MTKDQKLIYDQVVGAFKRVAPTDLMNTEKERGAGEQHWLPVKQIHRALEELSIQSFYSDCAISKDEGRRD